MFGHVLNGEMIQNEYDNLVEYIWRDLPYHNHHIKLDYYTIMPNHIHGIIVINNNEPYNESNIVDMGNVGAGSEPAPTFTKTTMKMETNILNANPYSNTTKPHKYHGLPEVIR
jgi:hypothetical protein